MFVDPHFQGLLDPHMLSSESDSESSSSDEDGFKKKRKAKKLKKRIPKTIQRRLERYLKSKIEDVLATKTKSKEDHLCIHMSSPYNNNADMKHLVGPGYPKKPENILDSHIHSLPLFFILF